MGRIRLLSILAAFLASSMVLAVSACSKGGAEPTLFLESPHLLLDGSQKQVFSASLKQLRDFSIFDKGVAELRKNEDLAAWLDEFKTSTGVDALRDVDRVVVALHEPWNPDDVFHDALVVVLGRFGDKAALLEGIRKFAASRYLDQVSGFVEEEHEGVAIHTSPRAVSRASGAAIDMVVAFPLDGMLLFSRNRSSVERAIEVMKGKRPDLASVAEWKPRLARASFGSAVWGVGAFPEELNDRIKERVHSDPDFARLIHLSRSVEFDFGFNYLGKEYQGQVDLLCKLVREGSGLAADFEEMRKRGIPGKYLASRLGEGDPRIPVWQSRFVDRIRVTSQAETATLTFTMNREEMEKFVGDLIEPPAPEPAAEAGADGGAAGPSPFD